MADPLDRLHALARDEKHHYFASRIGLKAGGFPLRRFVQGLFWTWFSVSGAARQFFRPERDMHRRPWHFFVDFGRMVYLALRFNLSPVHYYVYDLHRGSLAGDHVRRFLTGWEFHFLARRMARMRSLDVGMLDHKDRFAAFCAEQSLPHLAVLDLGDRDTIAGLAPRDLFVKGTKAYGGEGCRVLRHVVDPPGWEVGGAVTTGSELLAALKKLYEGKSFVVQYRERNHPEMQWLSGNVLTTLRIVTAWSPEREAVILGAAIRFPRCDQAILDNSTQGGIAAPVDPATGLISGPAIDWKEDYETSRPLHGERSFVGFQLPLWGEVKETVTRAHRAAGDFNFLGWDVALTAGGVILNECNVWSDIELIQVPQKSPLLQGRFLECLAAEFSAGPHAEYVERRDRPLIARPQGVPQ
jgi:hypothetical protein